MKKWLYKAEYKYGKYCIPNLMLVIVIGQAMVYVADMFAPSAGLSSTMALFWPSVMQGQLWRVFTFLFVPQTSSSVIWLLISLYFYYFLGTTLERTWGDFKFNVYYFCGAIGAVVAAALTGYGSNFYLNLSLFLAFAMLYPDMQVLLFFIIPVKVKYLAWIYAAVCAFNFVIGGMTARVSIIFSLINFFLFFGSDFFTSVKTYFKYSKTRRQWRNNNRR
jgi:membrane associated rhomboid family serine protease